MIYKAPKSQKESGRIKNLTAYDVYRVSLQRQNY